MQINNVTQKAIEREAELQLGINRAKKELEFAHSKIVAAESEVQKLKAINNDKDEALLLYKQKANILEEDILNIKKEKAKSEYNKDQLIKERDIKIIELKKKIKDMESQAGILEESYANEKSKRMASEQMLEKREHELARSQELLNTDKKVLEAQLKKKELEILRMEKKVEEIGHTINYKASQEVTLKHQLSSAEKIAEEYKNQMKKAVQDKELYESIAEKNRIEADTNKKLREAQLNQSIGLLKEKKTLEEKLYEKEYEASKIKKDLNIIQTNQEELIQEKIMKEQEVEALREHTEVLLGQNQVVSI